MDSKSTVDYTHGIRVYWLDWSIEFSYSAVLNMWIARYEAILVPTAYDPIR